MPLFGYLLFVYLRYFSAFGVVVSCGSLRVSPHTLVTLVLIYLPFHAFIYLLPCTVGLVGYLVGSPSPSSHWFIAAFTRLFVALRWFFMRWFALPCMLPPTLYRFLWLV